MSLDSQHAAPAQAGPAGSGECVNRPGDKDQQHNEHEAGVKKHDNPGLLACGRVIFRWAERVAGQDGEIEVIKDIRQPSSGMVRVAGETDFWYGFGMVQLLVVS